MNTSLLTDSQLYALKQNKRLSKEIRLAVGEELGKRNLSEAETQNLVNGFEIRKQGSQKKLAFKWKVLLLIFPFFFVIHNIIASIILDKGEERKWKEYWLFVSLGFLLYTILIIVFARRLAN
ncbi:MAG: hypothetical protein K2X48_12845 [Chitinophagaceae bacterium]|nr:hypothetical protein [Chitinophagaceae bacterium]